MSLWSQEDRLQSLLFAMLRSLPGDVDGARDTLYDPNAVFM